MGLPIGTVFPSQTCDTLGLTGRITEDGGVEFGFLIVGDDGTVCFVAKTEAYREQAEGKLA